MSQNLAWSTRIQARSQGCVICCCIKWSLASDAACVQVCGIECARSLRCCKHLDGTNRTSNPTDLIKAKHLDKALTSQHQGTQDSNNTDNQKIGHMMTTYTPHAMSHDRHSLNLWEHIAQQTQPTNLYTAMTHGGARPGRVLVQGQDRNAATCGAQSIEVIGDALVNCLIILLGQFCVFGSWIWFAVHSSRCAC